MVTREMVEEMRAASERLRHWAQYWASVPEAEAAGDFTLAAAALEAEIDRREHEATALAALRTLAGAP